MPQAWNSRPPSGRSKKRKESLLAERARNETDGNTVQESELWFEKHSPKSLADLVVHSKKVNDVRKWLELRLQGAGMGRGGCQLLLITGPPGVGKSAVVGLLGKVLGLEFLEWRTPTPTPWHEHLHQGFTGHRYTSKLDEFALFVEDARKFPVLAVQSGVNLSSKVKVLLIEDLPQVNDAAQTQQLCSLLQVLARSVFFVTVVVMTDATEAGEEGSIRSRGHRDAQQTLEGAGATKVSVTGLFPSLTCSWRSEMLDRLSEICAHTFMAAEKVGMSLSCLSEISLTSGRDGRGEKVSALQETGASRSPSGTGATSYSPFRRDNTFTLFHALGKFLHNKRHTDESAEVAQESLLVLSADYRRCRLNMEVPERILAEAQIEFSNLVAFLHENVLEFVDEEAIDDVVDILRYLSDADIILGRRPKGFSSLSTSLNDTTPSQIATLAAGSVAARGVLFANAHPAPRKWQSLRAPTLWQVERRMSEKKATHTALGTAALADQPRQDVSSIFSPDSPLEDIEDGAADDIKSLTASCVVDLDNLEDSNDDLFFLTPGKCMVHIDRGFHSRYSSVQEDMEDEDIIEEDLDW